MHLWSSGLGNCLLSSFTWVRVLPGVQSSCRNRYMEQKVKFETTVARLDSEHGMKKHLGTYSRYDLKFVFHCISSFHKGKRSTKSSLRGTYLCSSERVSSHDLKLTVPFLFEKYLSFHIFLETYSRYIINLTSYIRQRAVYRILVTNSSSG